MNYEHAVSEPPDHDDGKSEKMKPGKHFGQAFIVTGQPSQTSGQSETVLADPVARQQIKSLPDFWKLDDFLSNPVRCHILSGLLASFLCC